MAIERVTFAYDPEVHFDVARAIKAARADGVSRYIRKAIGFYEKHHEIGPPEIAQQLADIRAMIESGALVLSGEADSDERIEILDDLMSQFD